MYTCIFIYSLELLKKKYQYHISISTMYNLFTKQVLFEKLVDINIYCLCKAQRAKVYANKTQHMRNLTKHSCRN